MQRGGFKGEKGYCETDKKISRSIAGAYAGSWVAGNDGKRILLRGLWQRRICHCYKPLGKYHVQLGQWVLLPIRDTSSFHPEKNGES